MDEAQLRAELADANYWRKRHSDDAEKLGQQTMEQFNRIKELETQVETLKAKLVEANRQILLYRNEVARQRRTNADYLPYPDEEEFR